MAPKRSRQLNRLTMLNVENAKTEGWYADGGGLHLEVDANGNKRWKLRLTVAGRRRDFGLGPLAKVSLKQARDRAAHYRSLAYEGRDPTEQKRLAKPVRLAPTFEVCTRAVYDLRRKTWSNGKHVHQWINTLHDYAFPKIGKMPVDTITTAEVLDVLSPIWTDKPETARRVRQRISIILDWARAAGHRSGDNPVDLIGDALPKHKKTEKHHSALPYSEVRAFVQKLRASQIDTMSKLAFEFLILTAARTIEVRCALWAEVDLDAQLWTIPGHDKTTGRRMKSGRDHVVPLTRRAIAILADAKQAMPTSALIFPDRGTGCAMSENRFLVARDALGYTKQQCTPHGFRSSFRDWTSEETNFPHEVAEMALAHAIKSKTEAAYRRGALLARRREMMEAWATFVEPT
jgi:integrase